MVLHDGKDPACPIVQKHSKEGIEWICKIKRMEIGYEMQVYGSFVRKCQSSVRGWLLRKALQL